MGRSSVYILFYLPLRWLPNRIHARARAHPAIRALWSNSIASRPSSPTILASCSGLKSSYLRCWLYRLRHGRSPSRGSLLRSLYDRDGRHAKADQMFCHPHTVDRIIRILERDEDVASAVSGLRRSALLAPISTKDLSGYTILRPEDVAPSG